MAIKLDKFILAIAEKAGIAPSDPKLAQFLAHQAVRDIDIPDEVERGINQNLLSIDDAKNNHPQIKSHYFGEIMSNVDRSLEAVYREVGFTPDEVAELNQERSSTKRIALVGAKLKTKAEAAQAEGANGAKPNPNTEALTNQINALNAELAQVKSTLTTKEQEYNNSLSNIKIENQLASRLGLKTIYDTLPADVRETTLRTLLQKELQDNGVELKLDENGGLKLQKKDGSNYFDANNRLVSIDDFVNTSFAKHKILPQNNASDNGQQQQQQQQPPANGMNQQQQGSATNVFGNGQSTKRDLSSLYGDRMASLENANPTSIV